MKSLRPWLVGAALLAALGAVSPARADTAPTGLEQSAAAWVTPDAWSPGPEGTDRASDGSTQTWLLGTAAAGVALAAIDWKGSSRLGPASASVEQRAEPDGYTHGGSRVGSPATPEPASCLLLGAGVLLAGVRKRRTAKTSAPAA